MLDAWGARRMMAYLILIVRMLGTSGSRWNKGDTGVHRVHTGCAGDRADETATPAGPAADSSHGEDHDDRDPAEADLTRDHVMTFSRRVHQTPTQRISNKNKLQRNVEDLKLRSQGLVLISGMVGREK